MASLALPKPLAELFPDSFEPSDFGLIPREWRCEPLSALMTFQGGAQPPASEFISEMREGYVRLIQIRDFYSQDHITYVPDSPRLRTFAKDDVMIARYGSSGNAAKGMDSLGRVCRGLAGAYNVALVKVVQHRPVREFLYRLLQSEAVQATIKSMGARSVQSGFRKEDLDAIYVVTASRGIHSLFEDVTENFWHKILANREHSNTLACLRAALLPKLTSGELRIPEAERIVGAHV